VVIGSYDVIRRLGAGGMGAVYLARHKDLDRLVALKVLRDEFDDPSAVERFAREARAVAKLDHPNIVRIYDFGYHEGRPFLAMEYVAGDTLAAVIREARARSLDQVLDWMQQLCGGLAQAHDAGIVHRDIKPANLIVAASEQVKILDFGIARLANHSTLTSAGALIGTLNYMAPEQIAGRAVDARVDVFAAGAVCYELLTNRPAFSGPSPESVLHAVLQGAPPALAEVVPQLDPAFQSVIDRALAKEPAQRFHSIRELGEALHRARAAQGSAAASILLPVRGEASDAARGTTLPTRIKTTITTAITQHKKTAAVTGVGLVAFALIPFASKMFGNNPPAPPASTSMADTSPSPPAVLAPPVPETTAVVLGSLVIDATPWAEIVEIVRGDGAKVTIAAGTVTPSRLQVPVGEYNVALKGPDGTTQRLAARVTSEKTAEVSAKFRTVGAAEYLKRNKLP
jgi:serine/threonine-protein kinase